jgi:dTDP-4-amino-4,6-dideoxygalactose transaminase
MIVTGDEVLARRVRMLRSHGLTADTWAQHRRDAHDYDVIEPGFNYRLDEPRAALGQLLLGRLEHDNGRRALLVDRYRAALASIDGLRPVLEQQPGAHSAWHIAPVLLERGVDRPQFRARLRAAGAQTSVHYPPLDLTQAFARFSREPPSATEEYGRRTVTLPLFPDMTSDQQGCVIAAVAAACSAAPG